MNFHDALRAFLMGEVEYWPNIAAALHDELHAAVGLQASVDNIEVCFRNESTARLIESYYLSETRLKEAWIGDPKVPDPPDSDRIRRNALALVRSAQAAMAAIGGDVERLAECASETERLLGGSSGSATHGSVTSRTPESDESPGVVRLEAWCRARANAGQSFEAARLWIGLWFQDFRERAAASPELVMPIAYVLQTRTGDGGISYLKLARISDGNDVPVEHPDMALRPVSQKMIGAIGLAHAAAKRWGHGIRWSIESADRGAIEAIVRGPSLGAAARVGAELLAANPPRPANIGCLVAAAVDADRLVPVGGEYTKLVAAKQTGKCSVAVLAPRGQGDGERLTFAQLHELEHGIDGRSLRVFFCESVECAKSVVSGTATLIDAYLESAINSAATVGERVASLAGKDINDIYIDMNVKPRDARRADEATPRSPGSEKPEDEVRSWDDAFEQFASSQDQVLVLLGDAGAGKSEALWRRVKKMAEEGRVQIKSQGAAIEALSMPVFLKCADLASVLPTEGRRPDPKTDRDAIQRLIFDHIRNGADWARAIASMSHDVVDEAASEVLSLTGGRSGPGRIWLMLDGLDEGEFTPAVLRGLNALFGSEQPSRHVRVVIASRPYAYDGLRQGHADRCVAFDLAPFSEDQRDDFVDRWFKQAQSPRQERKDEVVRSVKSGSAGAMGATPILLTLLCWVGEDEGLAKYPTKVQLYRQVILKLLSEGRGLNADGFDPVAGLHHCADTWADLFQRWNENKELLRVDVVRGRFELGFEQQGCVESAKKLFNVLVDRRLLSVQDGGQTCQLPHRSFGEFLAAYGFARRWQTKPPASAVDLMRARLDAQGWRDMLVMTIGALGVCLEQPDRVGAIVSASEEASLPLMTILVGDGVAEGGDDCVPPHVRRRLQIRLLEIMRGEEPPKVRATAGDTLAHVGDPRFDPNLWNLPVFKPDPKNGELEPEPLLGFVEIPAGSFWMGSNISKDEQESS